MKPRFPVDFENPEASIHFDQQTYVIEQPPSVGRGDDPRSWLALLERAVDLRIARPLHRNRGAPRDTAEVGQHRQTEQLNPRDERQAQSRHGRARRPRYRWR
ncbi:hypothetical protein [Pseudomonas aeruginosa]|uniref:hypothetical protein n=1 Tax=Pseudomonas aeruginosa TaxID=287 RepID=UPI00187D1DEF|nr:hypothetical protein [Pseudomonas aeruginosa]